tara:strand:+ start:207 stop:560 length:354 start_codon:yes stop_codon:yes gene_type:complete
MGGQRDRRRRQQEAIDRGEPLRTKSGRKKQGEGKRGISAGGGRRIAEKSGKAMLDPSNTFRKGAYRSGIAGKKDSATIGRAVGYAYDAMTFGVAPASKLISDEVRSRKGKGHKKRKS